MTVPAPRASLSGVKAYTRPDVAPLDLSDNTNRWGAAPSAVEWLRRNSGLARYPEAYADELKVAIAQYLDVSPETITTGCGSNGVLDAAIRAFGEPGDRIAIPEPTFGMPASFARANALTPMHVALDADYQPDVEAITATSPSIVYLCSPNNPLGASITDARIAAIAAATPGLVMVDEAYAEFAEHSAIPLIRRHPNVLVVRTFSKAFGLAGARVGYGVGDPRVIDAVERSRGPYTLGALGAGCAVAALRHDTRWMRAGAFLASAERERLAASLRARGLLPLPSDANFLLVPLPDAADVAIALRARGIAVRLFRGLRAVSPALEASGGDALRITVGPRAEMDSLVAALDEARTEAACV